ncbi:MULTISPECIES: hypothetical protein [unclassified Bacillus (in: firmicutes)]|uniref:hypothetical protein n=1 Tax=unclassified Bacillus (in: firmicutes) TaxID=185979 RepID=UPI0008E0EF49|nr:MULTISPECIES: hypothetical protein [unclassified Bacillus (in: firmicutes)]SFA90410.1 hypothetical protein SAMN02799634_102479 [Bacillus sp. UNCCL13]SFQ85252.1 hypothetical protein SAMN04488577_2599 [Bacillus sp. cl95]
MSEYQQFQSEREKIDFLLQKGYVIHEVKEHLNGSTVVFLNPADKTQEVLEVGTANARKYFSTILFTQQKQKA